MPIDGQLSNWSWVGFSNSVGKISCNASSNVLFNIFNKMNSNLAYFGVSHNIEIMQLNGSNEFENEINKQLGKKNWTYRNLVSMTNIGLELLG